MAPAASQVLVVEDHHDTAEMYAMALEAAGYVVHAAKSVAEARVLLAAVTPDVLIADYSLPDGTGPALLELCQSARPKVCILVTGHDESNVEASGFHLVLTKPIRMTTLLGAIREHIAGRSA